MKIEKKLGLQRMKKVFKKYDVVTYFLTRHDPYSNLTKISLKTRIFLNLQYINIGKISPTPWQPCFFFFFFFFTKLNSLRKFGKGSPREHL